MHYEIAGSGPPIVLLHGIGSNSKSWRRQLEAFANHFTVVAWDAPGFGKSNLPHYEGRLESIEAYTESLRDLLDSLSLDSAVLLGHSFGGIIAQEFYREHPTRVRALILSDTTQGGGNPSKRLHMIRTLTPQELARQRAPKLLARNAPQDLIDEAIAIMSEVRQPGYESAAIAISKADTRGVLDNITIPLLMIWGVEDEITPPWKEWPKQARVEIIPNAGHLCYVEQPKLFNSIVIGFLMGTLVNES
jgi:pimeloyl-ACP methyl ester carboxylesterase